MTSSISCWAPGADVASAAQLACLLEASAPKPGNVSPGRHFADTRYEDFLASAVAIGGPLAGAGIRSVGATVKLAVEATARWTRSNTNLGIILLLTPIARAALEKESVEKGDGSHFPGPKVIEKGDGPVFPAQDEGPEKGYGYLLPGSEMTPVPIFRSLRDVLRRVLESTTVDDARDVYAAIRRAAPGGLGRADAQDVGSDPTVTLLEAMRLAADRDLVAREYATAFEITFETGVPALDRARRAGLSWDDAIVETFLTLLAANPDTHVARRGGAVLAAEVSNEAQRALAAGGVGSASGRRAIDDMDRRLRDARNTANPGTTADLTAAAIFVALVGGGWNAGDGGRYAASR
jgi:triphosphoribosyl-dephospho-CoA synthase